MSKKSYLPPTLIFTIITIFMTVFTTITTAYSLTIDNSASSFQWTASKLAGKHTGKIFIKSSQLKEGNVANKSDFTSTSGTVVMDMESITVEDLSGEMAQKFLGHIKNDDFFQVNKYPTATLKMVKIGKNEIEGELTIKDKTNPVKFSYSKNDQLITGILKFDRTKFNMIYGSGNFFKNLGDKVIHDEVVLEFKVKLIL
ncbi:MAG: YceI family protein [Oligoflexia bacterium]|nr:YceI family protein [Oligoflexia bacterium]